MTTLVLIPTRIERDVLAFQPVTGVEIRLCGMGSMASAVSATSWLAASRPRACVLVGLAGSRDVVRAPVASLVVGTAVRNEAVGCAHAASFVPLLEMAPFGEDVAPDPLPLHVPTSWMAAGSRSGSGAGGAVGIVAGEIGTVAAASASVDEADGWLSRDPAVLVEEMEGYAVGLACREAGVPLSIIRAVSNRAGVRDQKEWAVGEALAALRRFLEHALGAVS